jgi:flagellar basal body rod protein FlgG
MPTTNGMGSAASALRYWERRQEVLANNLANVDTGGFKAQRVFARMLDDALPVADTATDRSAGALRPTGEPLDLALAADDVFFVIDTPTGERYSRGGAFRLDEAGQIVDAAGNLLLSEGGPISVARGKVEVDSAGRVRVDGSDAGRLRLERVPQGARLEHDAGTLFVPGGAGEPVDAEIVRQGFVEESNVSAIESMVDMIAVQRAYTAVQKTVVALDEVRRTIANDLGKPV